MTACTVSQYLSARLDRRWDKAKRDIVLLSEQVAAYYQLESLYKAETASGSLKGKNSESILREMRDRVESNGKYERPKMTSADAKRIRDVWV